MNALDALESAGTGNTENLPVLAGELGQSSTYFKYPSGGAQADLYHQRHRGFQPPAAQGDHGPNRCVPTDDSLLKMLYLAMMDITKKWTGRRQDWERDPPRSCRSTLPDACPNNTAGAGRQGSARRCARRSDERRALPAALDIHPRPALYCTQGGSRINPLPRTMDDPALFMPHLEFTQNLGLTLDCGKENIMDLGRPAQ